MGDPLHIDIITIFPPIVRGFLDESIMKRAAQQAAVTFRVINLRDFTSDRHQTVDDRPYGGGPGMILKAEPFFKAVESARTPGARVILMSPQGRPFRQALAAELALERHLIFLCGHYEGVDERVSLGLVTDEISIGDYILTNGTLAAAVVIDAVVRLLPNVLGAEGAADYDSFSVYPLEHPQYTRPEEFRGMKVPSVLLSGNHSEIERWQNEQSKNRTRERRPDLTEKR
ncbi:MAG: tRNA (guanosine(37)-N1)-methyltransferase TrmD [Kiritimatiellae bacterium]|nr:tRNA (guanosine(37)-N1)-methyltransferase TrmD [Verrucomicrobiota bacterium]MBU4286503.1 tRNA (guanosine(37)-N1)-methyltransferase TrmD [Verrucomicrobiota bacterium]MBU4365623.1 tRNA (guanosine(37)-N1)-methyltransferase TrmD [Verrucomicrobiota bacterium]MCG2661551.1 tRNA (guanosine(37)-N1)-methyltransferase TrmD [Kiritimatiellia bacterium]